MKRFVPLIIGLSVILLGVIVWQVYYNSTHGTLSLTVVPSDAKISAEQNKTLKSGKSSLVPGDYNLTLTRDGFAPLTVKETVVANKTQADTVILEAINTTGLDYLRSHPSEQSLAEAVLGERGKAKGDKAVAAHPLVNVLPVTRRDFMINYGASQAHPSDPSALAIYITIGDPRAKPEALDWITAQGFNPADYEIIYQAPSAN